MSRLMVTFGFVSALVMGSASASATLIQYQGFGLAKGVTFTLMGEEDHVGAGQLRVLLDGELNAIAYCVDLEHQAKGEWTATPTTPDFLGSTGGLIAYLYETFAATVATKFDAAGLQTAIWELVYDDDRDLTSGNFKLSGWNNADIVARAQTYLASLPADHTPAASTVVLESDDDPKRQHLIVPEPTGLVLLGLAGLVVLPRRARQRVM